MYITSKISKTTVSKQAIANESGINFISVKGPELLNMVCKTSFDTGPGYDLLLKL